MPVGLKKKPGRPRDETLQARREEEILDAATQVFARSGYLRTDVQAVADVVNVGKGTIYRYFPTKRQLFLAAVDRGMRRLQARIDAAVADVPDPLNRIVQAIHTYLAFFHDHAELVELFVQERAEFKERKKPAYFVHREATIGPWLEMFRSLAASGRVRDLPAEQMGDVLNDLLYGTIFANCFAGRRASHQEQAERIVDLVFHGILTAAERKHRPFLKGVSEAR